jgi:Flp pilus assembly protein protease CpaA
MDPVSPPAVAVAIGSVIACVTDVRTGKIPNALTLSMMALGLAMNASLGDWTFGVYGLLAAFAVHYPLWWIQLEKGGDAKLLMGVGALVGPWLVLEASLWYAVLYFPVGLAMLALQGKLGNLIAALRWTADKAQGKPVGARPEPTMLRTAPVIAAATSFAFATHWMERVMW